MRHSRSKRHACDLCGRLHEIDDCLVSQACQEAGREVRGACARLTRGPTARETIREGRFEQDGHSSQDGSQDPSERVCQPQPLSLSFGRGMKGPRAGSRQRQHSTAVRITVTIDPTMTKTERGPKKGDTSSWPTVKQDEANCHKVMDKRH